MRSILKDQNGIALFLVLWVLMLLSVIVGEFCSAMRTEVNITRNFKEQTQALYFAEAGLNRAIAELLKNGGRPMPVPAENPDGTTEEDQIRWRINSSIGPIPFAEGGFEIRIENESGKVNLNRAGRPLLRLMLSSFELTDTEKDVIVDSILDWRDADDLHQLNGAENDYYRQLLQPYDCKNGDFDSVAELLLVRGVSKELFHGGLKFIISVAQKSEVRITTRRRGKTKDSRFNYDRINLNAASPRMLLSLPQMTEELAQSIIEYRQEGDFISLGDLALIVGSDVYGEVSRFLTLQNTPYYTIQSIGRIDGSRAKKGVQVLLKLDVGEKNGYQILEKKTGIREEV